jgi:hypothetical protein
MKKLFWLKEMCKVLQLGQRSYYHLEWLHLRAKTKILTYEEKITFILIQDSGMESTITAINFSGTKLSKLQLPTTCKN